MRRIELLNALRRIDDDLEQASLRDLLRQALGKDSKEGILFDLVKYTQFMNQVAGYGDIEVEVLRRLDLFSVILPEYWQEIAASPTHERIISVYQALDQVHTVIPRIISLLERDYAADGQANDRGMPGLTGKSVFTIILPEDDNNFSSPERVIIAVTSISLIYKVVAAIDGFDANDLAVVGCDSGSDKSFDFLGLASVIENVRGFISDVWDRILLGRQQQMGANIGLLTQSLPAIEKLEQFAENGTLSREQCEILKRQLIDGVSKFLDAGVITSDMVAQGAKTPRLIMQPQPRLLAAPQVHERQHAVPQGVNDPQPNDGAVDQTLSAEEAALLRKLLSKAEIESANPPGTRSKAPSRRRTTTQKKPTVPKTDK